MQVQVLYSQVPIKQVGPNKRVGWGNVFQNANRVDSFIWHLRGIYIWKLDKLAIQLFVKHTLKSYVYNFVLNSKSVPNLCLVRRSLSEKIPY